MSVSESEGGRRRPGGSARGAGGAGQEGAACCCRYQVRQNLGYGGRRPNLTASSPPGRDHHLAAVSAGRTWEEPPRPPPRPSFLLSPLLRGGRGEGSLAGSPHLPPGLRKGQSRQGTPPPVLRAQPVTRAAAARPSAAPAVPAGLRPGRSTLLRGGRAGPGRSGSTENEGTRRALPGEAAGRPLGGCR